MKNNLKIYSVVILVLIALSVGYVRAAHAEVNLENGLYHRHIALTNKEEWKGFDLELIYSTEHTEIGDFGPGWGSPANRRFIVAPDGTARVVSYCPREESIYAAQADKKKSSVELVNQMVQRGILSHLDRGKADDQPEYRFELWNENREQLKDLMQVEPVEGQSGIGSCIPKKLSIQKNGYRLTAADGKWLEFDRSGNNLGEKTDKKTILTFIRDSKGRVYSIKANDGRNATLNYSTGDLVAAIKTSDGREATFNYDDDGKLTSLVSLDGNRYDFTYYKNSNLLENVSENGDTKELIGYTPIGLVKTVTDEYGNTQWYSYFNGPVIEPDRFFGTVVANKDVNDVNSSVYQYWFKQSSHGEQLWRSFKEEDGSETVMWDDRGLPVKQQNDARVTEFKYDGKNRLIRKTDSNGMTIDLTYDDTVSMVSTVFYHDENNPKAKSVEVAYTYDARGNLLKAKTNNGDTFTLTYDDQDQTTSFSDGTIKAILVYNKLGKIDSIHVPGKGKILLSYDDSGQLKERRSELEKEYGGTSQQLS